MIDRLVVRGLGVLDGEYPFDLVELLSVGTPDSLTYRELHQIKVWSGVRSGEIPEAFDAGDSDLNLSIAAIVMLRANKRVDWDVLLDAPGTTEIRFVVGKREPEDGDADVPPVSGRPETGLTGTQSNDGGESSVRLLESQDGDRRRTGALGLALGRTTSGI